MVYISVKQLVLSSHFLLFIGTAIAFILNLWIAIVFFIGAAFVRMMAPHRQKPQVAQTPMWSIQFLGLYLLLTWSFDNGAYEFLSLLWQNRFSYTAIGGTALILLYAFLRDWFFIRSLNQIEISEFYGKE